MTVQVSHALLLASNDAPFCPMPRSYGTNLYIHGNNVYRFIYFSPILKTIPMFFGLHSPPVLPCPLLIKDDNLTPSRLLYA